MKREDTRRLGHGRVACRAQRQGMKCEERRPTGEAWMHLIQPLSLNYCYHARAFLDFVMNANSPVERYKW